MGCGRARTLFLTAISVAAVMAVSSGTGTSSSGGTGSLSGCYTAGVAPYLTVHGPNDGEPLNSTVDLRLEFSVQSRAFIYVFGNGLNLSVIPVGVVPGSTSQTLAYRVDTTQFPNGLMTLAFSLVSEWNQFLDGDEYQRWVSNPLIEVPGLPLGNLLLLRLRGRPVDVVYRLEAGKQASDLVRAPPLRTTSDSVVIDAGLLPRCENLPVWSSMTSPECQDVVLDLDGLTASGMQDGYLVLWTATDGGRWARSRVLSVKALPTLGQDPKPISGPVVESAGAER